MAHKVGFAENTVPTGWEVLAQAGSSGSALGLSRVAEQKLCWGPFHFGRTTEKEVRDYDLFRLKA